MFVPDHYEKENIDAVLSVLIYLLLCTLRLFITSGCHKRPYLSGLLILGASVQAPEMSQIARPYKRALGTCSMLDLNLEAFTACVPT